MAEEQQTPVETTDETVNPKSKHKGLMGLLDYLIELKEKIQQLLGTDKSKTQIAMLENLLKQTEKLADSMSDLADVACLRAFMDEETCEEIAKQAEELSVQIDGVDLDSADQEKIQHLIKELTAFDENWGEKMRNIYEFCIEAQDDLEKQGITQKLKLYKDGDTIAIGYTNEDNKVVVLKALDKELNEIKPIPSLTNLKEIEPSVDAVKFCEQVTQDRVKLHDKINYDRYADVYNKNIDGVHCERQSYSLDGRDTTSLLFTLRGSNANVRFITDPDNTDNIRQVIYEKDGQKIDVFKRSQLGSEALLNLVNDKEFAQLVGASPLDKSLLDSIKNMYTQAINLEKLEGGKTFGEEQHNSEHLFNEVADAMKIELLDEAIPCSITVPNEDSVAVMQIEYEGKTVNIYNRDVEGFPLDGWDFVAIDISKNPMVDVTNEIAEISNKAREHSVERMAETFGTHSEDVARFADMTLAEYVAMANDTYTFHTPVRITEVLDKYNELHPEAPLTEEQAYTQKWNGEVAEAPVQSQPVQEAPVQETPIQTEPTKAEPTREEPVMEAPAMDIYCTGNANRSKDGVAIDIQKKIVESRADVSFDIADSNAPQVGTLTDKASGEVGVVVNRDCMANGNTHTLGERDYMVISQDGENDLTEQFNSKMSVQKQSEQTYEQPKTQAKNKGQGQEH